MSGLLRYLLLFFCWVLVFTGYSQTPGVIVQKATGGGAAILDPNGDGFVSATTDGFTTNDKTQSEIMYRAIPMPGLEPNSDLGPGPDCMYTDFVDSGEEDPALLAYDASGNMLIRLRMGGLAPNSKGYSIFIDVDQKLGFTGPNADPNALLGNPGFEIELSCQTNFGIYLYDVDGTTSPVLETSLLGTDYYQKSVALSADCGDPDYFYDYYIPFSTITAAFPTVTTSTKLRMAIMSSMSPAAALGSNSQSDLTGVDDEDYNYNYNQMFITVIENFYPSTIVELGSATVPDRSSCPLINGVIKSTSTSISGTSVHADGTVIKVYKNGNLLGSTVVASGTWTLNGVAGLIVSDVITATATASGKSESVGNCDSEIVASCDATTSVLAAGDFAYIGGAKGFDITVSRPVGTIVKCYYSDYTLIDPVILALEAPYNLNTVTTTTNPEQVKFKCQTGNCFGTGVYYFTVQEPGKCPSDYFMDCHYSSGVASTTPVITSPATITTVSTSISGTSTANAQIFIYADGVLIGSATADGSGNWTKSSLTFTTGQVIMVKALESGKCVSAASATKTVSYKTNTPVIVGEYCTAGTITSISGYVFESSGTVQVYKNAVAHGAPATINANGSWTATGLSLVAGDVVTAVATVASSTASEISASVIIGGKTSNAVVITTPVITEGDASVSGTGTNGDVIRLYADGVQIGSSTVVAGGVWTIGALASYELYSGATVTATATSAGMCVSDASASKVVSCIPPSVTLDFTVLDDEIIEGNTITITVHNSELGTLYQMMVGLVETGSSRLGNGGDLILTSGILNQNSTISVKTIKVVENSCSNTLNKTAGITVLDNPLPIDLVFFNAKCRNDRVEISWATANESNNDYFSLEKADNSLNFKEFKQVKGAGNSNSMLTYHEVDVLPLDVTYYQIRQTDFDGKSKVYGPISVFCDLGEDLSIENELYEQSSLSFNFVIRNMEPHIVYFNLIDKTGNVIFSRSEIIDREGVHRILFNPLTLSTGIYMIVAECDQKTTIKKIFVVN